ncbi:monovalent cation:proton antiporter-2 (CPA2) family protein [Kaarinaea lacus]
MEHKILLEVIILLAGSVIAVALFKRLRLPPILSYFIVGIVVGPNALGWIPSTEDIRFLAEFGIVFLMFTIGLEFSIPKLKMLKGIVFGLGFTQVAVTTFIFGAIAYKLGLSINSAFVVGSLLAMSSTAIVTKQLVEELELNSRHGHIAVGVLLFQDLAVIPLLVIIPILAAESPGGIWIPISISLSKAAAVFAIMLVIGRWIIGPLLHEVAKARSAELFTLTVLLLSLAAAMITHTLDLSLALGGFLAGIALGETTYRHQVEDDIRPFQDVLLGLFFITIGMLIDVNALLDIWPWVLLLALGIIVLKAIIIFMLALFFRFHGVVATRSAIVLAQCGEFGFVLLSLAISWDLLDVKTNQVILGSILLSMLIAPVLIRHNEAVAKRLHAVGFVSYRNELIKDISNEAEHLKDHIIFCGYGRVGQNLARMLESEGYQYIALDLDPVRVREALEAGDNVYYGDSARQQILNAAGIAKARLLVVTFDSPANTFKILERAQKLRPDIHILVRSRDETHLEAFQAAGATEVVPETTEASLMLGAHMLFLLDTPLSRIFRITQDIRSDRYQLLRGFFHGMESSPLDSNEELREQLLTIRLFKGAYAISKTLAELNLEELGVKVTALRRGGIKGPKPIPNTKLHEDDIIVLLGNPKNLERAQKRLHVG